MNVWDTESLLNEALGSGTGLAWLMGICAVLTLLLTVIIYVALVPHERSGVHKGSRAFFGFEKLIIAPIFKFLYILCAVAILVFGIALAILLLVEAIRYSIATFAEAAGLLLLCVIVGELLTRIVWELLFLTLKLVSDVSAIRGQLDDLGAAPVDARHATRVVEPAPAPAAQAAYYPDFARHAAPVQGDVARTQPMPVVTEEAEPVAAVPAGQATTVMPASAPASAPGDGTWDCVCGKKDNEGRFCTLCGRQRPE